MSLPRELVTPYTGTAPSYPNPVCSCAIDIAHNHSPVVVNLITKVDITHTNRVFLSVSASVRSREGIVKPSSPQQIP